jgi:hypothetical protein
VTTTRPLRIANCSGFFGDRLSAAREMIDGGPIDVLTGDWLAELTMGVLAKQQAVDPDAGFAKTFLVQLEDVLSDCVDRNIKIVANAGGLNPRGLAIKVRALAQRLGKPIRVAVVDGDDAREAFKRAVAAGWEAPHLDSGKPFSTLGAEAVVANAYLGGWGIASALTAGADVVITGRVTDAAIILGPAAWHFGWERDNWDALAGTVAAGHVIECGAQATGGNFSFFTEIGDLSKAGFPIAEIFPDGSSVITKHPGTGGMVTVETVTAQLLYEIEGPRYMNPDVVTRLDTARLEQVGADRVRISGVRGEPAPESVKVGIIASGGWRNSMTFVLTGGDVEAKALTAERVLWAEIPNGRDAFDSVTVRLLRGDKPNPRTIAEAVALFTVTVTGRDRNAVGAFSRAAVETGLSSYPGLYFTAPPGPASEFTIFWPTLLPAIAFVQRVTLDDASWEVAHTVAGRAADIGSTYEVRNSSPGNAQTELVPLGTLLGARSGDKAGNAILGVWARNDKTHQWLRSWWSEENLLELIPEARGLELRLWELPLLRACGVTIVGFLGHGVAANPALDSQGKGLGEYVRAKYKEVPVALLPKEGSCHD